MSSELFPAPLKPTGLYRKDKQTDILKVSNASFGAFEIVQKCSFASTTMMTVGGPIPPMAFVRECSEQREKGRKKGEKKVQK